MPKVFIGDLHSIHPNIIPTICGFCRHPWPCDTAQMTILTRRANKILRGNQREDGSVSGEMVNDVLGILEGKW